MGARLQALRRFFHREPTWEDRFAPYLTEDRAYTDFETGRVMYRGAAYCLNCKAKVMERGSLCDECRGIETVSVPPPPSPAEQAAAWAKMDRMADERRKDEAKQNS